MSVGTSDGGVRCEICPKACRLLPGQSGSCRARVNIDGRVVPVTYGRPCSMHVDPHRKETFLSLSSGHPDFFAGNGRL